MPFSSSNSFRLSTSINSFPLYVISPQFDGLYQDGDLYLIKQNDKSGWATRQGKVVVNPQFAAAFTFNGAAIAPVQLGNTWGYVDKGGKIIIKPQFEVALPFVGGGSSSHPWWKSRIY